MTSCSAVTDLGRRVSGVAAKKTSTKTGRYLLCPFSNIDHAVVGGELMRGQKSDWASCSVCACRVYRSKVRKNLERLPPAKQVIAMGAIVPEHLTAAPPAGSPQPVLPPMRRSRKEAT